MGNRVVLDVLWPIPGLDGDREWGLRGWVPMMVLVHDVDHCNFWWLANHKMTLPQHSTNDAHLADGKEAVAEEATLHGKRRRR